MKQRLSLPRQVIAWLAYPGVVLGSVVFASALLDRGVSAGIATTLAFVLTLLATLALERIQPHERSWNASPRETLPDLAYLGIAAASQSVARNIAHLIAGLVTIALASRLGTQPWPRGWPLWEQMLLAVGIADLAKYSVHRLSHETPWLWRYHAAHHAPTRLYALNGTRMHPVNVIWNVGIDAGFVLAFGLGGRALALVTAFRGAVSVLQHANVEMRLGPLNRLLSTPVLHQWHHSSRLAESNANYGSTFIIWDILFGTYALPREARAPIGLGLVPGGVQPVRLWHQLLWPWCERRASTCRSVRGWTADAGAR